LDAALLVESALLPGAGHEELTYAIAPRVLIETVGASVAALTHKAHV
jgi:prolyl-tRNA editing enzyme YbaK/EbsC (Cys-tRNA(Pro) deacylase)